MRRVRAASSLIAIAVLSGSPAPIVEAHYLVDPNASEVRAFLPAASLSSDRALSRHHVVQARDLRGRVIIEVDDDVRCRVDVAIPTETLAVDPPRLREELGWEAMPYEERAAMRRRVGEVLPAEHSNLELRAERCDPGAAGIVVLRAALTMRGVTKQLDVPMLVSFERDVIQAAGVFTLLPQDFGIPSPPSGERIHTGHAITVAFRVVALRSAVVFEI